MALIACRECAKEISSDAPACPHCGVPKALDAACRHCRRAVSGDAQLCPHCGTLSPVRAKKSSAGAMSNWAIAGIVCLIGLIVLVAILSRSEESRKESQRIHEYVEMTSDICKRDFRSIEQYKKCMNDLPRLVDEINAAKRR